MNKNTPKDIGLMDALHSTPARRYLSEESIPDEIIIDLLNAAIRAPSGGNNQGWGWLVLKDKLKKAQISEWYREGWDSAYGVRKSKILNKTDESDSLGPRNFLSAEHLANNIQHAPVWIIAILRDAATSKNPRAGASIYGAVQHLMLAARAYGIGATLTTLYSGHEDDVKRLLGIPNDAMTMALIPLGYPSKGRWSEPKRQPISEVAYMDNWGQALI
tara:strand:+ start:1049 stop:1699 length:651 start_codon:yes stop_codon:yes gene_type:complete